VGTQTITRETEGKWKGNLYSGSAGVYYLARMGRLSLRPLASIDHYKLSEKGYEESGGGAAFDLSVGKRSSSETAANAVLNVGYDLMGFKANAPWLRVELEGGRRQILSSKLGSTTARFEDGEAFTLTPEERTSGWLAALRVSGGGSFMSVVGEVSAEEQQGHASVGARLGLQMPF
jgi:hypothetical protein